MRIPKVGDKIKCKKCGAVDVIIQDYLAVLKESPEMWNNKIYCVFCGSDETYYTNNKKE